jgi:hypothetical protein
VSLFNFTGVMFRLSTVTAVRRDMFVKGISDSKSVLKVHCGTIPPSSPLLRYCWQRAWEAHNVSVACHSNHAALRAEPLFGAWIAMKRQSIMLHDPKRDVIEYRR